MTINHSREVGDQVGDLRVLSVTVLPEWAKSWMGKKASLLCYAKLGPAWFSGLNSNRRVFAPNPAAGSQISYHLERVCFVIEISSAVGLLVVVVFSFLYGSGAFIWQCIELDPGSNLSGPQILNSVYYTVHSQETSALGRGKLRGGSIGSCLALLQGCFVPGMGLKCLAGDGPFMSPFAFDKFVFAPRLHRPRTFPEKLSHCWAFRNEKACSIQGNCFVGFGFFNYCLLVCTDLLFFVCVLVDYMKSNMRLTLQLRAKLSRRSTSF